MMDMKMGWNTGFLLFVLFCRRGKCRVWINVDWLGITGCECMFIIVLQVQVSVSKWGRQHYGLGVLIPGCHGCPQILFSLIIWSELAFYFLLLHPLQHKALPFYLFFLWHFNGISKLGCKSVLDKVAHLLCKI